MKPEIEFGTFDVSQERDKYIGGSDIPVLMELSPYRRREELVEEKAGLRQNCFPGNQYTRFGRDMEPLIRDYVNHSLNTDFRPARLIAGDLRLHTDGYDGRRVLEIKTTGRLRKSLPEYKAYLVQLIKYMDAYGSREGVLAVYRRPADLSLTLDPAALQIWQLSLADWRELLQQVNRAISAFRSDVEKLRQNPLTDAADLIPGPMRDLGEKLAIFENQLARMRKLEAEAKALKAQLFDAMTTQGVKTWQLPSGTRLTLVEATEPRKQQVTTFDTDTFRAENPGLYELYLKEEVTEANGRAGYIKVTT